MRSTSQFWFKSSAAVLLALLVACTTSTPPLSHQQNLSSATTVAGRRTQAEAGPMRLAIQTDLMQPGAAGAKRIDLMALAEEKGFRTQALPNGPLVFQEQFTKTTSDLEITRPFAAADTSRRYTLHVEKMSGTPTGSIEVNLNGIDWIKAEAFANGQEESQQNSLLLNANNSLRVRIQGAEGAAFQVSVVEAGAAGTILRPQGRPGPNDTQATRVQRNDTNIFDPSNPNSLGGLEPYEGDLLTEEYGPPIRIGESQANGTKARIRVGVLTVVLKQPVADNLAALQTRFPVTVLNEYDSFGDRFVTLAVNFEDVELNQLADNFEQLNQRSDAPILQEAVFSSINTAKTIALAAQLESQALDLIYGVSLENMGEKAGVAIETQEETQSMPISEVMTRNQATLTTPPSNPVKASDLWWLDEIKARQAWNYSMGENATVAVIDSNFGILLNNTTTIPNPPDFQDRLVKKEDAERFLMNCSRATGASDDIKKANCRDAFNDQSQYTNGQLRSGPGHGLWVTSLLASGDNDQDGIVGVAPRAKILPMYQDGGVEGPITHQLDELYKSSPIIPIDVFSISLSRALHFYDVYFANTTFINELSQRLGLPGLPIFPGLVQDRAATPSIVKLSHAIYKLSSERNVIFVVAAGNDGLMWDVGGQDSGVPSLAIPGALNHVIPVGAYQKDGSSLKRAIFDIYSKGDVASNYGSHISMWAPGKALWVQGYDFVSGHYQPRWDVLQGTSHATPLVAGAVALLKSMVKGLSFNDISTILSASGSSLTDPSFHKNMTTSNRIIGLDVLGAVQLLNQIVPAFARSLPAKNYCIQRTFFGEPGSSVNSFSDLNNGIPGSGPINVTIAGHRSKEKDDQDQDKPQNLLEFMPDIEVGDFVNVLGWSKAERFYMAENELHAIQVTKSATSCQQGSFGIQSIASSPPPSPPPIINVWLNRDSQQLEVNPEMVVGVAINDQELENLVIEVNGEQMPLLHLAQNFASFSFPPHIEPGVKDVVLKLAGNRVELNGALKVVPEPDQGLVDIDTNKKAIFTHDLEQVEYTFTLKNPDGSPMADGTLIFVEIMGHPVIRRPDGSAYNGSSPVVNGQVKLLVSTAGGVGKMGYPQNTWPSRADGHPAFWVNRVCRRGYSSQHGNICASEIEPMGTYEGLVFQKSMYSMKASPNPVKYYGNEPSRVVEVSFYDRAGLPVPDGTSFSPRGGGNFSWDTTSTTQNKWLVHFQPPAANCGGSSSVTIRLGYWSDFNDDVGYLTAQPAVTEGC